MTITFIDAEKIKSKAVVVPAYEGTLPEVKGLDLDKKAQQTLHTALKNNEFKGKKGSVSLVPALGDYGWVIALGLGKKGDITPLVLEEIGGSLYAGISGLPVEDIALVLPDELHGKIKDEDAAARLASGFVLRSYSFRKYKTKDNEDDKAPKVKKLAIATSAHKAAKKAFEPLEAVARGVFLARDLQSEPANVIYPETLAKAAVDALSGLGVKVDILGEKEMKKLGMNALLGVGQGSVRESQLVVMQYQGGAKGKEPVALVGKGATFDSGGISIKPAANMEDMKWDMGGAAVVIGTLLALASRKAAVNVVGVIGLVENMPSGTAQRPGDIVTSMSGQTIEVINTDAEGRLVLADALWYTQEQFKPQWIIDFATLTGAIVVALGEITAGLFSNNDTLARQIEQAAEATGEALWRLPLKADYDKDIDSDAADMKNVGSGRGAGSITAAQFLQRFIKDGQVWAHIDIAGVTWAKKPTSLFPKGATAYGVRLMDALIAQHYEGK